MAKYLGDDDSFIISSTKKNRYEFLFSNPNPSNINLYFFIGKELCSLQLHTNQLHVTNTWHSIKMKLNNKYDNIRTFMISYCIRDWKHLFNDFYHF